ncbi:MAG TPA: hypothetical protein VH062_26450 [Polyangiaceae bacterium]|nr:hypothetical protein [Polyangiaceae bacterium]
MIDRVARRRFDVTKPECDPTTDSGIGEPSHRPGVGKSSSDVRVRERPRRRQQSTPRLGGCRQRESR